MNCICDQEFGQRRRAATVFALCVVVAQAGAQSNPRADVDTGGLVIEAVAGWDGTVDQQTPIPISLLINNYGVEAIEGHLYLSDPDTNADISLGELFIGAGAKRRFAAIQSLADWSECYVSLRQGTKTIWRRPLVLNTGQGYDAGVNSVLFIDDGGRKLTFPNAPPARATLSDDQLVAPESGRAVRTITVKSWQIPDHPGPLTVAEAMVFADEFDAATLNRAQWNSVSLWMCLGGRVFMHEGSAEAVERLLSSAPLAAADESTTKNEFVVREMGLGSLYTYSGRLLASEGNQVRQAIANVSTLLPKPTLFHTVNMLDIHRKQTGRSDWNKLTVAGFFLCYAILSGIVSLLLFRLSRRQMGIYIASVVLVACLLAALLGILLRNSRGDLRWATVTSPGAGGIVQVGRIDVQSAGARNRHVSVTGQDIDLQATGVAHRWYHWNNQRTSYPPFIWQPNLAKEEEHRFQTRVHMTPWGARRLLAFGFQADVPMLDFELEFGTPTMPPKEKKDNGNRGRWNLISSLDMPTVPVTMQLKNNLPFELSDCRLIVAATTKSSGSDQALQQYSSWRQQAPAWATEGTPIDVYHTRRLKRLAPGALMSDEFKAKFRVVDDHWHRACVWDEAGSMATPKLSRLGTASAWIVGRLRKSPVIEIDESNGDFVSQDELHLFVQPIDPDRLRNAAVLLGTAAEK